MELKNFLEDIKSNEKAFQYLGKPEKLIDGFIEELNKKYPETTVNKFFPKEKEYDSFYIKDRKINYFRPIGRVFEYDFMSLKRVRRQNENIILSLDDKTLVLDETFDIIMILPSCDDIVVNDNIYLLKNNKVYKYDKKTNEFTVYFEYSNSTVIYSISFDRENILLYVKDVSDNFKIDKVNDAGYETIIEFVLKNDYDENSKIDFYFKEFHSQDEEGNDIVTFEDYILISSLNAVDEYKFVDKYIYNKSYSKPRELTGELQIKDYSYYNDKIALALENKILILDCKNNNLYNILGTEVLVQEEDKYLLDSTISIVGCQLNIYNICYIDKSLNKIVSLPIDYKKEINIKYDGEITGTVVTNYPGFNIDTKELKIKVGENIPGVLLLEVRE